MIDIEVPTSWLVERNAGPFTLLARPRGRHPLPSPVVNVLVGPLDGRSLDEHIAIQLDTLATTLASFRLLQHEVTAETLPAEVRLLAAFEQNGADLTCYQRQIVVSEAHVVIVTATASDVEWPDVADVMLRAVHSVEP